MLLFCVYLLRLGILAAFLLLATWQAALLSYSTPDNRVVSNLGSWVETYATEVGHFPNSWEELETKYPTRTNSFLKPRVRYAFLPEGARPHISGYRGGELFFISRKPFRDVTWEQIFIFRVKGLTERQRYGLIRYGTNSVRGVNLREPEVQALFASQKIPLPTPDNLPEREWIATIERRTLGWRIVSITVFAGVVLIGGAKLWRSGHVMRAMGKVPR